MAKKYQLRRLRISRGNGSYIKNHKSVNIYNLKMRRRNLHDIVDTTSAGPFVGPRQAIVDKTNAIYKPFVGPPQPYYPFLQLGSRPSGKVTPQPIKHNYVIALFISVVFLFVLSTVLMGNRINPVDGALGVANIIAEWGGTMSTGFKSIFDSINNALVEVEVVDTSGNFFTVVFGTIANFFKFFWNFFVVIFNFLIGIWNLALNIIKLILSIIGSLLGIR